MVPWSRRRNTRVVLNRPHHPWGRLLRSRTKRATAILMENPRKGDPTDLRLSARTFARSSCLPRVSRRRSKARGHAGRRDEHERGGTVGGAFAEPLQRAVAPHGTKRSPEALECARGPLHSSLLVLSGSTAHERRQ